MIFEIIYLKGKRLPSIRLNNLEDIVVHVSGDVSGTLHLSRDFIETWATYHKGPPEHYILKIALNHLIFKKHMSS